MSSSGGQVWQSPSAIVDRFLLLVVCLKPVQVMTMRRPPSWSAFHFYFQLNMTVLRSHNELVYHFSSFLLGPNGAGARSCRHQGVCVDTWNSSGRTSGTSVLTICLHSVSLPSPDGLWSSSRAALRVASREPDGHADGDDHDDDDRHRRRGVLLVHLHPLL